MFVTTPSINATASAETIPASAPLPSPTCIAPRIVPSASATGTVRPEVTDSGDQGQRRGGPLGRGRRRDASSGQPPLQPLSRGRQPAPDRPDRAAQLTGRHLVGQPFEVAKHDRRTELLGQPPDLFLKDAGEVPIKQVAPIRAVNPLSRSFRRASARDVSDATARDRAREATRSATPCNHDPTESADRIDRARLASTRNVAWKASSASWRSPSTADRLATPSDRASIPRRRRRPRPPRRVRRDGPRTVPPARGRSARPPSPPRTRRTGISARCGMVRSPRLVSSQRRHMPSLLPR